MVASTSGTRLLVELDAVRSGEPQHEPDLVQRQHREVGARDEDRDAGDPVLPREPLDQAPRTPARAAPAAARRARSRPPERVRNRAARSPRPGSPAPGEHMTTSVASTYGTSKSSRRRSAPTTGTPARFAAAARARPPRSAPREHAHERRAASSSRPPARTAPGAAPRASSFSSCAASAPLTTSGRVVLGGDRAAPSRGPRRRTGLSLSPSARPAATVVAARVDRLQDADREQVRNHRRAADRHERAAGCPSPARCPSSCRR